MAKFSYDTELPTDMDRVRLYIADTEENSGPRPGKANYSDDEVLAVITAEGSWARAVAGFFEILAGEWGPYVDIAVGPRREQLSQVAERFHTMGMDWRRRHGGGGGSGVGTAFPTPVDGYSQDIATDEV
jgi:H+/Cl- antiporter ClcA